MGRRLQKGTRGEAVHYYSRKQALRKLQLTLKDFRRICILKGIYPHEPKNRKKVNLGSTANATKTFYYRKDIQFLLHEPVIGKFREFKVYARRLSKMLNKGDIKTANRVRRSYPHYKLDHIVRERYPSFQDAIRDLDDALCMTFLFSRFPHSKKTNVKNVAMCQRLSIEFMHYVMHTRSLRKVFISIKGYYYQADICGETVTWLVPHHFGYQKSYDVDIQVMSTFTEFYITMLGFVNFKLYHDINLKYPPKLSYKRSKEDAALASVDEQMSEHVAALNRSLLEAYASRPEDEPEIDDFPEGVTSEQIAEKKREQEKVEKQKNLFNKLKFFVGREVPREPFVFVIRSFGGEVSWDKSLHLGSTYEEDDNSITHQIVDRPKVVTRYMSRYYIQPQWVFDCVNQCKLLPVNDYFPGATLPPHLSPFAPAEEEEEDGEDAQDESEKLVKEIVQEEMEVEDEEDKKEEVTEGEEEQKAVETPATRSRHRIRHRKKVKPHQEIVAKKSNMEVMVGAVKPVDVNKNRELESKEEKKLAVMMIPKKHKQLYKKIMYGKRRTQREAHQLRQKREAINREKSRAGK